MAIQKEIWLSDIVESLFPDNSFFKKGRDDSPFVLGGKTVHIPQSGGAPTVVKNRGTVPATIGERTDTDLTYTLDEYTTDPILVKDSDEMETSYAKRESILSEHVSAINETVGDHMAYAWSASGAGNILRTSGSAVAAASPSATGNRKGLTSEDIRNLAEKFDGQSVPRENRHLLLPSNMYYQLFDESQLAVWDSMGTHVLPNGQIRMLYGFELMVRPSVLVYDNSGTPVVKSVGAAGATDDNLAALAWHRDSVAFAEGNVELYINEGEAAYYGDVFSAMVRAGGRKRRTDHKGVAAIVQDASA